MLLPAREATTDLRKVLVSLIVLSTIAFVVGSLLERSSAETHGSESGVEQPGDADEGEEVEGTGESTAPAGESSEESSDEQVFGIDPESTGVLLVAVVVSLLLAAGCWFRPEWRWLLVVTALAMAVFAVLDLRELIHQVDESNAGLAVVAGAVAILHGAAAVAAAMLARRSRAASTAA